MKKRFLIIIFILVSVFFISNDLFARRSGGRSGSRRFSSRRSSSSYSGSSRRSSSSYSGSSSTRRKGLGYYDPNSNRRVGTYVEDDGSDFLFYIISLILGGIIWFIFTVTNFKKYMGIYIKKFFDKLDDVTWPEQTIISFSLLVDKLDFDLQEKIYFFSPDCNVRIHKVLEELVENSDKILKFTNLKLEKGLKFDKTQKKVDKIKQDYENLTSNIPDAELYLVSIVASYTPKLNIEEKENYTKEDYQNILKEMLKLNKYFLIDNVKHSNVTINKVKSDFDFSTVAK